MAMSERKILALAWAGLVVGVILLIYGIVGMVMYFCGIY